MTSRWSISALCAFFVVVGIAVSGCGSSGTDGAPVAVAGNPVPKRAIDHYMYLIDKSQVDEEGGGGTVIVPVDPPQFNGCITQARTEIPTEVKGESTTKLRAACKSLFQTLSGQALNFLIPSYWIQAQAYRKGVTVSSSEIQQQIDTIMKENGATTAAKFNELLAAQGTNLQDLQYQERVELLDKKLATKIQAPVTSADIAAYYAKNKSKFGSPESRNMRIVLTTSKAKAQAALAALRGGQSWGVVAKKYSQDPSKDSGGLLTNVTVGSQDQSLTTAAFAAPLNKLIGPVKATFGYYIIDVIKITPATQKSLAQETATIRSTLTQTNLTTAENTVTSDAKKAFMSKTSCSSAYSMADCNGYKKPKATSSSSATATQSATTSASSSATTTSSTSSK